MRRFPLLIPLTLAAVMGTLMVLSPAKPTLDIFPFCVYDVCVGKVAECELVHVGTNPLNGLPVGWYKCHRVWTVWEIQRYFRNKTMYVYSYVVNGTIETDPSLYLWICSDYNASKWEQCSVNIETSFNGSIADVYNKAVIFILGVPSRKIDIVEIT